MTISEVNGAVAKMLQIRTNTMMKIKIKCWEYHSKSRIKNGNEPYTFDEYNHAQGKQLYLDYINYNFIDCSDVGGKDKAIEAVDHWFG